MGADMDIGKRIEQLVKAVETEQGQRDWLLSVDWSDNGGTAQEAALHHDQVIATYLALIDRLKERQ
jgi:hypothetical protein